MGNFSESKSISFVDRVTACEKAIVADEALYSLFLSAPLGNQYYLDPVSGLDTNDGSTWAKAFLTAAHALTVIQDNDSLFFKGTISEDTLTLAKNGVSIVGAIPARGGNVWQASSAGAAVDKTLLTITGKNCKLMNFKVRPPAYSAGVPKGISISGASYLRLLGMRFQGLAGSWYGLYSDVTSDNVLIDDCEFLYFNTATYGYAIYGVAAAGTCHSAWRIRNSYFSGNVNNYVAPSDSCLFEGNTMPDYGVGPSGTAIQTTKKIDVSGTNAQCNQVHKNVLGGGALSHATGYYGVTTNDNWSGNQLDSGSLSASTPPTS